MRHCEVESCTEDSYACPCPCAACRAACEVNRLRDAETRAESDMLKAANAMHEIVAGLTRPKPPFDWSARFDAVLDELPDLVNRYMATRKRADEAELRANTAAIPPARCAPID